MVLERNNKTLEKILGITPTKTAAAAVDTTMEKLLQRIQTPPIYQMGQPSSPSAQPSGQKPLHAPPLSSAWAHAPPSINLTAHPIRFYSSSLFNRLTLPIIHRHTCRPSPPDSNLQNCQICTAVQICPSTIYNNLSSIGTGLTNTITDWGLKRTSHRHPSIMDSHIRAVFEVSASLAQTNLPMYSKNSVISLPNVPSNYITNSFAFSARSLTHDNGKPILVCEHYKKQRYTKDQCWKLHGRSPRGNKRSSNEQQNSGRTNKIQDKPKYKAFGTSLLITLTQALNHSTE
uniref:Beta-galactosidase n=1 Tax=Cucumis melo TaxID=3656 RepID=A0A9I9EGT2_CUCME